MAKIFRKLQKIFALDAANNGQFGSAQLGTKVLSSDVDTLQALSAWDNGWLDAVVSPQTLPTLEEMQATNYVNTYQLKYLFQEGIPEYLSTEKYFQNSIVKKAGTYQLYGSTVDDNIGNALTDPTKWVFLVDLSNISPLVPLLEAVYPIGSLYMNKTVSTNPNVIFGFGTWAAITDKFIVAHGSTYTSTGGAATVTLSTGNLPASSLGFTLPIYTASPGVTNRIGGGGPSSGGSPVGSYTGTTNNMGSGTAFDIIPPYQAAYIWERTA